MKIRRIVLGSICACFAFLFVACTGKMEDVEQFRSVVRFLETREPLYASVVTTDSEKSYGTEELYISGEDYLHISTGPDGSWERTELYVGGDLYTGFESFISPKETFPFALKYDTPEPQIPWLGISWDTVKDTIVFTEEKDGVLQIVCEDGEITITYCIEEGKIVSIAYNGLEKLYDENSGPVYHEFTRTFVFHETTDKEVDAMLESYLAKAEE